MGFGATARRALERASTARSLRRRRPPRIPVGAPTAEPTVYYLCPDYQVPSGGIRVIYRHVDVLNASGRAAAVLHHSDGFACDWFEHSTRVLGAPSVRLSAEDVLVVPEVYGPYLERLPRKPTLVAFNQNAYLTYEHLPSGASPDYEIFAAAMTVSDDSAEFLRFAFPGLDVSVVPNTVDADLFHPGSERPAPRLALMPRKRPADAAEILRLLGPRLEGWEVVAIEGCSEVETADLLRSAPLFLALGRREGFGMPAAEAMASGCYVTGFGGFGGRDLFDPACSAPVEDGDVLGAARELGRAIELWDGCPKEIRELGARARERVLERWSPQRQRTALLEFFERVPRTRSES
jgi:glycosyltransferase involved in cell wall biosynthesis